MKNTCLKKQMMVLLVSLLVVFLFSTVAFGIETSGTCGDNVTWSFDETSGTLTISGNGEIANFQYSQAAPWVDMRDRITTVVIEEGVTSIGNDAFRNCNNIATVKIPKSMLSLGNWSFPYYPQSSMKDLQYAGSIDEWMAMGNGENHGVTCGDGVTYYPCGETTYGFFERSTRTLYVRGSGEIGAHGDWEDIKEFTKKIKIENGITDVGYSAFSAFKAVTEVEIPDTVVTIDAGAFHGLAISHITIPSSVKHIYGSDYWYTGAFKSCSQLVDITLPDGLITLGDHIFAECYNLPYVDIPASVTEIGPAAFLACRNLNNIVLPEGIDKIAERTFQYCYKLDHIEIPENVTSIGGSAFQKCTSLTNIVLPEKVVSIGGEAFDGCEALQTITIPKAMDQISSDAFLGCDNLDLVYYDGTAAEWNNILIADGNEPLLQAARKYSDSTDCIVIFHKNNEEPISYQWVNIGEAVEEPNKPKRADYVFRGWYSDKELTTKYDFSTPVTSDIRLYAKWARSSGTRQCGDDVWWTLRDNQLSISGSGDMWDYNDVAPAPWRDYAPDIESVVIAPGVTSVGSYAFASCANLTDVSVPKGVCTIGDGAFSGCSSLTEIDLPEGITMIGSFAFSNCGLMEFAFPEGVTSINLAALCDCSSLRQVTIPASAITAYTERSFEDRAFFYNFTGCSNLERFIVAPGNTKYISINGVLVCQLKEAERLLVSCPTKKKAVEIPCDITDIFYSAFRNCTDLETVYYEGTEDQWRDIYVEEGNESLLNANMIYNSHMPEASLSGAIISWNNRDDAVIRLYDSALTDAVIKADTAGAQAVYSAAKGGVTAGGDGKHFRQSFTFEGVGSGSYKLLVAKPGKYVPQIIAVSVEEGAVVLDDITLWLYGDLNNDGRINSKDVTQLSRYTAGNLGRVNKLDMIGDVNSDGRVNSKDVTQLSKYTAGNSSSLDKIQ